MSESPETKRLKPKLFTKGKYVILVIAILSGPALFIIREHLTRGSVSGLTLGTSVVTVVIGLIILVVMGWYANQPER